MSNVDDNKRILSYRNSLFYSASKTVQAKLQRIQSRSLEVYGQNLRNSLPLELRLSPSLGVFKSNLKTFCLRATQFYIDFKSFILVYPLHCVF